MFLIGRFFVDYDNHLKSTNNLFKLIYLIIIVCEFLLLNRDNTFNKFTFYLHENEKVRDDIINHSGNMYRFFFSIKEIGNKRMKEIFSKKEIVFFSLPKLHSVANLHPFFFLFIISENFIFIFSKNIKTDEQSGALHKFINK